MIISQDFTSQFKFSHRKKLRYMKALHSLTIHLEIRLAKEKLNPYLFIVNAVHS